MSDGPAPSPSRRDARRRERRQAIIAAARASFLNHGYAGTSMSGLLTSLGGSKATLWSHFRSKEELFAAVIEDVTAGFRAELADVLNPAAALEPGLLAFCRRFIVTLKLPDSVATWRLVVAESGRFPEIGIIFHERVASFTQRSLATFLAPFAADGTLRDEDPSVMARMLLDLCVGRQNDMLWGVRRTGGDVEGDALRFVAWFMRAFAPPVHDR